MFENLSEKLQRAFKSLRGQAVLSPENMEEALREIRLALLEADVNFKGESDRPGSGDRTVAGRPGDQDFA